MQKLELRDYQREAVDTILEDKKVLFQASTGAGKTVVATEAMREAGTEINLIVAPLNTVKGWRDTLARQGVGELRFVDALKAGKQAMLDLINEVPGYYFMGYERARTIHWGKFRVDFVVFDEVHRCANHKSVNHKMMRTLKHSEYTLSLSATPAGNTPSGLFAVARTTWDNPFGYKSFWKFCAEYLRGEYDPFAFRNTKYTSELQPGKIMQDLPSVIQVDKSFKGAIAVHNVEVKLNPTQRKVYQELEQDSIAFLDDNPLVAELPATKYIRLMETTLATPSIEYDTNEFGEPVERIYFKEEAKSSKADAILEILSDLNAEKPEPVVIYTHSRKFADFLTTRLESKGHRARKFVGGITSEERISLIEEFGESFEVMVATIQAIGEGVDGLQHVSSTEIWASVSDQHILNHQAKGRVHRNGQERLVNRYFIRAIDTLELQKQAGRLAQTSRILEETYNGTNK